MNLLVPQSPRRVAVEEGGRHRAGAAETLLPTPSLSDIMEVFWRRRWSVVAITVLSILLTFGYLLLLRGDVYLAEAKIVVRIGQEHAPPPTMVDRSGVMSPVVGLAAAEMEMLRSRDIIAMVVDRIDLSKRDEPPPTSLFGRVKDTAKRGWRWVREGLDEALVLVGLKPRMTEREAAIESIARALLVETQPQSNVFSARLIWPERGVPRVLLQMLVDTYMQHRAALFQGATATQFFRERRGETGQRLAEAELALAEFEREHGIVDPVEQRSGLLRRLAEAATGVDGARLEMQLAQTALDQLKAAEARGEEELAAFAVAQYGSGFQQSLASDLAAAASRLLAAQTTLNPQDVNIRRLQAGMLALSRAMAQQLEATGEQRRRQLELRERQRDALEAEVAALQAAIGRWTELQRAAASALRAFEYNDGKLNEAVSVAALEEARIGNVVVVQAAAEMATPAGVRKSTMLMLAAIGGLMVALSWVVLREFFDHRLKTPGDVQRWLGLRLLATVPEDRRRLRAGLRPEAETDAEFARVAAALGRFVGQEGMNVLVVTSGADGEGASTVVAEVGRHMVEMFGVRVLLVDLGGQRPGLADHARGLPRAPAVLRLEGRSASEVLAGDGGGWAVADLHGLDPVALRPALDGVLAAAKGRYDLVMVDSPPWRSGPATLLAIRASSHVMLVAAADSLSREPLERLCADLEEERVELVGCVFNRYRRQLPRWLHDLLR